MYKLMVFFLVGSAVLTRSHFGCFVTCIGAIDLPTLDFFYVQLSSFLGGEIDITRYENVTKHENLRKVDWTEHKSKFEWQLSAIERLAEI